MPILNGDVSRYLAIDKAIMRALDTLADAHCQLQYNYQELESMGHDVGILYKKAHHGALRQLQPDFKEQDEEKKEKEKALSRLEALQSDLYASPQVRSEINK